MIEKRKREPLYIQIAEELREEITDGEYIDSEKIPSETKLSTKMGVSRTTIREAVGILEKDGLVNRIHGVGTIITRSDIPVSGGAERLKSFTESIKDLDMKPGTSYIDFHWEKADEKIADDLDIKTGSLIAVIERVRTGDNKPMMYTVDKLPISIIGENFTIEEMGESLFVYLREQRGINLGYSELQLRAIAAEAEIAKRLNLSPESPVLAAEEKYFDKNQEPIIYCVNIFRTDLYHFKIIGRAE
ncbi:MAG: GntR family transcriptional regulator [Halanaerobium sp.]